MNQTIYDKNISALKFIQSHIVSRLKGIDLKNQDHFMVFKGINDCNVLKVKKDNGDYILYNSFYDPYKEAKEITHNIDYEINRSLIISIGAGLGYHLLEMLNHINEKSVLLVIEKDGAILKNLLHYIDLSEFITEGKLFFILASSEDELSKEIPAMLRKLFSNILSVQTQVLPIADVGYIQYCKAVLKIVSNTKTTLIFTMGNSIDDTLIGIDNRIRNLPHIIKNPGLREFKERYQNVYKGKPAIIIASGPSLDKNIHLLKAAQGKALLLACDGSMESLKKHGITPDIVSSIERIMLTYEAFYKDKEMPYDTVLAAPAVIRPEIFQSFRTKTLSLFKEEPISEIFNQMVFDKGKVWSGASVAHLLMGLARAMGADPIILVGQDLAYSSEGVSHTREAAVKEKVDVSKVEYFVKDIYGKDIPTTFVWKQFLEIFEYAIRGFGLNCIDATEGGAYIQGTEIMTLKEVIEKYCHEDIPKFRDLVDALEVEEEYIRKAYVRVFRSLMKLSKRFYVIMKKCEKALQFHEDAQLLLDHGIKTQNELDRVYDAIYYVEYKVVRKILLHPALKMFFQYLIMNAVSRINALGTEITFNALSKNLEIQKELLDALIYYCKKTLFVLRTDFNYVRWKAGDFFVDSELEDFIYPDWTI